MFAGNAGCWMVTGLRVHETIGRGAHLFSSAVRARGMLAFAASASAGTTVAATAVGTHLTAS